jgi:formylglycine-generating enzyme required for sulfatase activity/tRNA A-37 threonylcarbamoyl transferase component Bud32
MPTTTLTVADLVARLGEHQLLSAAQQEELTGELQARFADLRALAKELVRRGWLTPYQANLLVQGKGQELVLGQYVILERLGEGGMGRVYKARHRRLDRIDAVKVIRPEHLDNPAAVQRFQREARSAARLDHSNIVRVYDAGEAGGTHYLALEYVEGKDLGRLVKESGPLPVALACDYARQAALGLQHAHKHGLVHRDIKPQNLLLSSSPLAPGEREGGGEGTVRVVKILDMGLARLQHAAAEDKSSSLTGEGAVVGTMDFLAPEQALDAHRVDIRADLYSLGCTLYYLLTGQVPFPGGTAAEKILKHQKAAPTPAEQLRPELPVGVAVLLGRLLAKRPAERYQTPAELAGALRPFCPARQPETVSGSMTLSAFAGDLQAGPAERGFFGRLGARPVARPAAVAGLVVLAFLLGLVLAPRGRPTPAGADSGDSGSPQAAAQELSLAQLDKEISNSIGMKLVLIKPGKFLMGTPGDQGPELLHEVEITRPFYMGKFEVTQGQYEKVMGMNPSSNRASLDHPVESVSWFDAVEFCHRLSLSAAERPHGRMYLLPTEAEWEYCCRAGASTAYSFGDDAKELKDYAWYTENSDKNTHPVGQLKPNAWGLYDMHGNVWEWCWDWYSADYYQISKSPKQDPPGPSAGGTRVLRGGAWDYGLTNCRAAYRGGNHAPTSHIKGIGFRVVLRPALGRVRP